MLSDPSLRWFEDALCAGRKVVDGRAGSCWAGEERAAAIWAGAVKMSVITWRAEGALEGADQRAGLISGQVAIAAFASGTHVESHFWVLLFLFQTRAAGHVNVQPPLVCCQGLISLR